MSAMPKSRLARRLAIGTAAAGLALAPTAAFAGSNGTGTVQASLLGGALSVNSVTGAASPISATIGGTGNGDLPTVQMQDATGTGAGWNGTVAVSDLNYTGTWQPSGAAPALTTSTSGAFTDTADGVTYTVTVTGAGIAAGTGTFSYTSTDPADASGTGTSVATTANAVGTKGLTINFATQTVPANSVYTIHAGTQAASSLSLNTGAAGASVTTVSGNTAPGLVNNGSTLTGGGAAATAFGSAVKFVSAAVGTGMGAYNVVPGATFNPDSNSFASTYSAGVQYTIVAGP